ncbi:MAG: nitronate monooxygenase [Chitinophagales bacterium]|nr:nitronate monooxygenase [Bacteroidota bacterium]
MSIPTQTLREILGIEFPVIMAPMFLVSNTDMLIAAAENGITAAVPALNYRTDEAFRAALKLLKEKCPGPFGVNLITNQSNYKYPEQLKACVDYKVDYIITSLGSPQPVIDACKPHGIKVLCDVVNEEYAAKVVAMGADALIAVNAEAGGHLGKIPSAELIPSLLKFGIPVISAGGVGTGEGIYQKMQLGAAGVSMGSIFIASKEAPVSEEYKQACVDYSADDIVVTTRLSGTPCTVINTPYVRESGLKQNWLENLLNKHRSLKRYAKMLTFYKGMKSLEKAAFSATYKTMWVAGQSIEHVHAVESIAVIVDRLKREYAAAEKVG